MSPTLPFLLPILWVVGSPSKEALVTLCTKLWNHSITQIPRQFFDHNRALKRLLSHILKFPVILPTLDQSIIILFLGQHWSLVFPEEREPSLDQRFKHRREVVNLFTHEIPFSLDHILMVVFVNHSSSPCDEWDHIPNFSLFDVFIFQIVQEIDCAFSCVQGPFVQV